MTTNAYSELYLDDAMQNLGDMVEFAVCDLGYHPDEFLGWFISSGVASKFEKGNPRYIAGMSGVELAKEVLHQTNVSCDKTEKRQTGKYGREFWGGWIFAYYQWITGRRFEDIVADGLSLSTIFDMYILHEADISKFVQTADDMIRSNKEKEKSKLHKIRLARGFTQKELSEASGVSLRMIQLYEQRQNDIGKAQVKMVLSLARALGCEIEDLIE